MWYSITVPLPGIEPVPPALAAQSHHWTPKEVPIYLCFHCSWVLCHIYKASPYLSWFFKYSFINSFHKKFIKFWYCSKHCFRGWVSVLNKANHEYRFWALLLRSLALFLTSPVISFFYILHISSIGNLTWYKLWGSTFFPNWQPIQSCSSLAK